MTHKTLYNRPQLFTQSNGEKVALVVNVNTASDNISVIIGSGVCQVTLDIPVKEIDTLMVSLMAAKAALLK